MEIRLTKITLLNLETFAPLLTEDLLYAVENSAAGLRKGPPLLVIGAAAADAAAGILICETEGLTVRVRHIEVAAAYRKQGVAREMMDWALVKAEALGALLVITFGAADEEAAIFRLVSSYPSAEIEVMGEKLYRISLRKLAGQSPLDGVPSDFQGLSFFDIPEFIRRGFFREIGAVQLYPPSEERYIRQYCRCAVIGGKITACVLIKSGKDDDLQLSCARSLRGHEQELIRLLQYCRKAIGREDRRADVYLYVPTSGSSAEKLVDKLLPSREIYERVYMAVFNPTVE